MSIQIMTHVWNCSQQKGVYLLMLLAIADQANDDGDCYPGVGRLAFKTRMSERNAQKVIHKLQKDGDITISINSGIETGHGKTNRYHVVTDGVSKSTPRQMSKRTPLGVSKSTPKSLVEPSVEPKKKDSFLQSKIEEEDFIPIPSL